jgi:hypothetical protein
MQIFKIYIIFLLLIVNSYAFLKPRFGYNTLNINKLINSAWLDIRSMPALQMLNAIYSRVMKTIYEQSNRNHKSNFLVNA